MTNGSFRKRLGGINCPIGESPILINIYNSSVLVLLLFLGFLPFLGGGGGCFGDLRAVPEIDGVNSITVETPTGLFEWFHTFFSYM